MLWSVGVLFVKCLCVFGVSGFDSKTIYTTKVGILALGAMPGIAGELCFYVFSLFQALMERLFRHKKRCSRSRGYALERLCFCCRVVSAFRCLRLWLKDDLHEPNRHSRSRGYAWDYRRTVFLHVLWTGGQQRMFFTWFRGSGYGRQCILYVFCVTSPDPVHTGIELLKILNSSSINWTIELLKVPNSINKLKNWKIELFRQKFNKLNYWNIERFSIFGSMYWNIVFFQFLNSIYWTYCS